MGFLFPPPITKEKAKKVKQPLSKSKKKKRQEALTHHPQKVPHLRARHVGKRVELDQRARASGAPLEHGVHLHDGGGLPRPGGLVLALAGHPRRQRLELPPQGLHLPHAAALGVAVLVEGEHALLADKGHGLLCVREGVLDSVEKEKKSFFF